MHAGHSLLTDPYGREVRSLRLSVTQRCDFTCNHCHREGQAPSREEMSPAEMGRLVSVASSLGVRKVKLTGGEPLIRDDILEIVARISPIVREVSLTTNGSHLASMASALKFAGLNRVNVSLHSLNRDRYARLCGVDCVEEIRAGIKAAIEAALNPVKVNMVVFKDENEEEIELMMEFCAKAGAVLQLIEYETDREASNGCYFAKRYCSLKPLEEMLAQRAVSTSFNELHRRRKYRIGANGGYVTVEVVRPMHNTEFCSNCTRIRMSSDGRLKPCLLDPSGEVDVLTPLRNGASDRELRELFVRAAENRRPYWR